MAAPGHQTQRNSLVFGPFSGVFSKNLPPSCFQRAWFPGLRILCATHKRLGNYPAKFPMVQIQLFLLVVLPAVGGSLRWFSSVLLFAPATLIFLVVPARWVVLFGSSLRSCDTCLPRRPCPVGGALRFFSSLLCATSRTHSAVTCWYGGLPGAPHPSVRRVSHTRIGLAAPNGSPLVLVYTTAL